MDAALTTQDKEHPTLAPCEYCVACNKDLKEAWREIQELKEELAKLRRNGNGNNGNSSD